MQDTFLGISPTLLAFLLAGGTLGVVLLVIGLGTGNPLLWRIGLRNIVRRPGRTTIMLLGLVLSTVLVTASFGLQDSFAFSQTRYRVMQAGTVDDAVSGPLTQDMVNTGLAHLHQMPEVESASALLVQRLAAKVTDVATSLTTPGVDLFAVSPDFDQVYGSLTTNAAQPVHFADLKPNEVLISPTLAQIADIHAGQAIQVNLGDHLINVTVRAVLAHDVMVFAAELSFNSSFPEVILPLATVQAALQSKGSGSAPIVPNVICIKQSALGHTQSQKITTFLEQNFHAHIDENGTVPTDLTLLLVHPLQPDVVNSQGAFNAVSSKSEVIASPAARQFNFLLPAFTALLVGAGMLLLALLMMLLAAERRAELGLGRAIGLSRGHLILSLLIEGTGYGMLAAFLGIPLGLGATALSLSILSQIPAGAGGALGVAPVQSGSVPLLVSLSWQSALTAWCISVLTTSLVVLAMAIWVSRLSVVAAIRDLDEPVTEARSLLKLFQSLWRAPRDEVGQIVYETGARRRERTLGAAGDLVVALLLRGPLCLAVAAVILGLYVFQGQAQAEQYGWDALWLLGLMIAIAGGGLLLNWLLSLWRVPQNLARRLGWSGIGLGWLIIGIESKEGFLFAFEPVWNRTPSLFAIVLTMILPLLGGVILVMTNADLIIAALSQALRRIPRLAPVSRISLVYPLTFRFRTTVTIALLSLIMVLILLMVTTNLSLLQTIHSQSTTGGFSLELVLDNQENQALSSQLQQLPDSLNHEVTTVAFLQNSYGVIRSKTKPMLLHLPSRQPEQFSSSWGGPVIADDSFLTHNTLPLLVRAQNYTTDQQVWDAVRLHTDYALLRYDSSIDGLPTNDGFTPFLADVPESDEPTAHYHQVTIIGLLPATSHWDALFISRQTATAIWGGIPSTSGVHCYFQVKQGVSLAQVSRDVNRTLHLGERGIALSTLDSSDNDVYTTHLTVFLGGYLALGLLFGALSIGVVASRAVVERRQQIGMLRALGFSRPLVGWSFLLETSFVITLSLAIGTILAGWLAYQALRQGSQSFPVPVVPVVLILLSSYLIVLLCTTLPAQRASRLSPAEALRYE